MAAEIRTITDKGNDDKGFNDANFSAFGEI
jgi:hypothetical protein